MPSPSPIAGIEVASSALKVLSAGFELFPSLVKKFTVSKGILEAGEGGKLAIPEDRWFPLDGWLAVLEMVRKEIGPNALLKLGSSITVNPKLPGHLRDVDTALESIDIAFHRSHRKAGVVMYDLATGNMLEGIGHYRTSRVAIARRNEIAVMSDTPYPCEIDLGIVTGMATKFEPKAHVSHVSGSCRLKGGEYCRYVVTW